MTTAALTAKAIRKELKEKFPNVRFRVFSENYSLGNLVNIIFTDPTIRHADVWNICEKYQEGHFNAMTDSYEYDNKIEGLPQVKFVTVRQSRFSDA